MPNKSHTKARSILAHLSGTIIGVIVFAGLAGFTFSYDKFSLKDGTDFVWQLITFSFVLGTLCLTFSSSVFTAADRRGIAAIGLFYVLSGVAMIGANGLFSIGTYDKWSWLQFIGSLLFILAEAFVSCSIAIMTMLFIGRIFPSLKII